MNLYNVDFALLKYCPSRVLGEQVNIGIFLFFKEDNELKFIFPSNLERLNSLFPEINLNIIKTYLHNFKTKVNTLSEDKKLLKELSTTQLLSEKLLVPDSTSWFFDTIKSTKYYTIEEATQRFEKEYFAPYDKYKLNLT